MWLVWLNKNEEGHALGWMERASKLSPSSFIAGWVEKRGGGPGVKRKNVIHVR